MFTSISQFEPLFPSKSGELEDLAKRLVAVSAKLESRLSPVVLADIRELLRVVNSYYSNLIEGNGTHPIDIERAMAGDYSSNAQKRDLQIESRIHIEVQRKISGKLKENPDEIITNEDFLCWVHRQFYAQLPENLRWAKGENNEKVWVEAGNLRERLVIVGNHIPPVAESLNSFLQRFNVAYNPLKMNGLRPIIALSAAHHRLMWIHPFLDGNGRVARLFTDAYFEKFKLEGYGLWNVSRGLARKRDDYRKYLAVADSEIENDFDGRENLSDKSLTDFCGFFLETCLDQAEYMNNLLSLNGFMERLEKYVQLRNAGLIVDEKGERLAKLHPRVGKIFAEMAIKGEISRGEVFQIIEMSERSGRNILKNLLDEGLLLSKSEKGLVRLGFPTHAANYWFPDLYPTESRS